MKPVICFDLWGTLIYSTYTGQTYREYIASQGGWPLPFVRQIIREYLMTTPGDEFSPYTRIETNWSDPRGTEREYCQLSRVLVALFALDSNGSSKDEHASNIARMWKQENQAIQWVPGAKGILRKLKDVAWLVLITNVTLPGWSQIEDQLKLRDRFSWCYLSFRQSYAKPNPMVWHTVKSWFDELDEDEGELNERRQFWMIGNSEENDLVVPRRLGWKTLLVGRDGRDLPKIFSHLLEGGENGKSNNH